MYGGALCRTSRELKNIAEHILMMTLTNFIRTTNANQNTKFFFLFGCDPVGMNKIQPTVHVRSLRDYLMPILLRRAGTEGYLNQS